MTPEDPRHGTSAGASAHYRDDEPPCPECREGDAIAGRRRRKRRLQGYVFRVELGERNHKRLTELRDEGIPFQQIADWAGVSYRTAHDAITGGPNGRVATSTFNAFATMRPATRITSAGLARRVQALQWLGYSIRRLSREMDISAQWLREVRDARVHGPVTFACRDRIVATYERLHMTVPDTETTNQRKSVNRARNDAARLGFLPPLSWDDDTIDDPEARPHGATRGARPLKTEVDPAVVQRVLGGDRMPTTRAEKLAITAAWEQSGRSLNDLERATGWKSDRYTVRAAS